MEVREYANAIKLHEPFIRPAKTSHQHKLLITLLDYFNEESNRQHTIPRDIGAQKKLLRAMLNVRQAKDVPDSILANLNSYLWCDRLEAQIVDCNEMPAMLSHAGSEISIWRGDITRLNTDAIVNAANKELQGCFTPLHMCIDNAIHSAAGIQVRSDCARIVALQNGTEGTGDAKITRAYNLPSRYILHTVGPIVQEDLQTHHRQLLASSYTSCLDVANEIADIHSVAFCCISTGVFGFPGDEAADIAIESVLTWLRQNNHHLRQIIFNVFTEQDHERYTRRLEERSGNV
ncbi:MAG TPA: protein-ADP-ribose hydrolase [Cyclobacteriaceae bacterium]|jgi:O-acetyl-ADP-ribose deacetylase (regulator of RNase III)|nr:protein-ADP-ribose hydrolase [Cyclobacteriaceae bacterium]